MGKKIKAFFPHIIVNTSDVKPCYSIVYYDVADKHWHIGFSSFKLSFVRKWLKEEFEEVDVEFVEVVRCKDCKHWINKHGGFCQASNALSEVNNENNDFCSYGERKQKNDFKEWKKRGRKQRFSMI